MPEDSTPWRPASALSLLSPGLVATQEVGKFYKAEIYGLVPGLDRSLRTVEFYQGGREGMGIVANKPVAWDIKIPPRARLFSVTSGMSTSSVKQFWMGWVTEDAIHAQPLTDDSDLVSPLQAGEVPIFPAIMDGRGRAALYTWRPRSGGTSLRRHEFSKSDAMPAADVFERATAPVVTVATAIPGEPTRHAVLGWIETVPEGVMLVLAVLSEGPPRLFATPPVTDVVAFPQQRPGVWAGSFDRLEVTAVVVGKPPAARYSLLRLSVNPSSPHGSWARTEIELRPGQLQSAAIDYYKDPSQADRKALFLTTDGRLLVPGGGEELREVRENVPLDSVLPVVTTASGGYWGERAADGSLTLKGF